MFDRNPGAAILSAPSVASDRSHGACSVCKQICEFDKDATLLEWVVAGDARIADLEIRERNLRDSDEDDHDVEEYVARQAGWQERVENADFYTARARAARLIRGLGFSSEMQSSLNAKQLSGGWRTRLYLVCIITPEGSRLLREGVSCAKRRRRTRLRATPPRRCSRRRTTTTTKRAQSPARSSCTTAPGRTGRARAPLTFRG